MIRSFRDKETRKLFDRERSRAVPGALKKPALRKLLILDAAENLEDLRTYSLFEPAKIVVVVDSTVLADLAAAAGLIEEAAAGFRGDVMAAAPGLEVVI